MASVFQIDRASAEPFYLQLEGWIERQINGGVFGVGDVLPSETKLCRDFGLSRHTVRETIRLLQEKGRVRVVQRRGAFVAALPAPSWMVQFAEGFSEAETRYQRTVDTKVLRVAYEVLPAEAAQALELPPGSPGVIVERVRKLDGELALYGLNYLIPSLAPVIGNGDTLRGTGSLNRLLRQAGWHVHGARRSLSAVSANRALGQHGSA